MLEWSLRGGGGWCHGGDGMAEIFQADPVGPVMEDKAGEVEVCSWACGE